MRDGFASIRQQYPYLAFPEGFRPGVTLMMELADKAEIQLSQKGSI